MAALLFVSSAAAVAFEYAPTEVLFIEWGDGALQLKICEPFVEINPEDTTDRMIWDCGGPDWGFVDKNENFYFALGYFGEFKAFRPDGSLLLDFSKETPGYNPAFFRHEPGKFYVDSLCRIYFDSDIDTDFVAVADTLGNLVEKLSPYGVGSGRRIVSLYFNVDDVLFLKTVQGPFDTSRVSWTYRGGQFVPGGCYRRARDGYCYGAHTFDSLTLEFSRWTDCDSLGNCGPVQSEIRGYQTPIEYSYLAGVDDDMHFYVYIDPSGVPIQLRTLAIFNVSYELEADITLELYQNRYDWSLQEFVRRDGNVYEFRCLDDGMHIIRWKRE